MVSPIVIAGPTGCGKSTFAINLAKKIGGEIICADSRQIYAGMQIGSAAPSPDQQAQVPHLGYGTRDPQNPYDAALFIRDTDLYVQQVIKRGATPILVGGTGLYLRSWRFGLDDAPPADPDVRQTLNDEQKNLGLDHLYDKLKQIDPISATRILPLDAFRIKRALEIFLITQRPASSLRQTELTSPARVEAQWLLMVPQDKQAYHRQIEIRVDHMFADGLTEEALALRNSLPPHHRLLETMGFEEALLVADGKVSLEEAKISVSSRHKKYAKRQITWFKKEPWWQRIDKQI